MQHAGKLSSDAAKDESAGSEAAGEGEKKKEGVRTLPSPSPFTLLRTELSLPSVTFPSNQHILVMSAH